MMDDQEKIMGVKNLILESTVEGPITRNAQLRCSAETGRARSYHLEW
jgi:hypothetical protein